MANTDSNENQNTFQRPTHILLSEMRDLHEAMKDLCNQFNILAERMEQCAAKINEVDRSTSRKLFRDFRNAGVEIGRYIRFEDGQDTRALFHVVDMDAEGFWLKIEPDGGEYHLKMLPNRDRLPFIRTYAATSTYIRKALLKEGDLREFRKAADQAEEKDAALPPDVAETGGEKPSVDEEALGFRQAWKPRERKEQ